MKRWTMSDEINGFVIKALEEDLAELEEFLSDDDWEMAALRLKRRRKKYYWNAGIQTRDKDNGINLERRKFNPTVIIQADKRMGVRKKQHKFNDDMVFNEMNN